MSERRQITTIPFLTAGIVILFFAAAVAACGGGGGGAADDCATLCNKAKACTGNQINDICDPATCEGILDRLRDEISVGLVACANDAPQLCEPDWTSCLSSAAKSAGTRPIDTAYSQACLDKRMTCTFADDLCLGTVLYDQVRVEQAKACLDKPCDQIVACIKAELGT